MGCLNSKPQENTDGDGTMRVPVPASVAAAAPQPQQSQVVEPVAEPVSDKRDDGAHTATSCVQDWSERSDDLKSHILHCRPADKRTESYIASLADLAKRSFQKREYFGEPGVIQSLLVALRDGPPPVAKASAHALRLLSFCHPNHTKFRKCEDSVHILITSLQHQEYKVTIGCLSALCNLSASPECVRGYATDDRLLACLDRILTQNIQDSDPQSHAAQLLLNLTRVSIEVPQIAPDECTVVSASTREQTINTSSQPFPPDLRSTTGFTLKSTRDSDSQPSNKVLGVTTASASEAPSDDIAHRFTRCEHAVLMATGLHVLAHASSLDQEARENCIEVILALLQSPDSTDEPASQAASEFIKKQGLAIIIKESLRENVLASTQVLIAQILHLFARTHFEELVDANFISAIGRMLSHKTKRGADERHLDVDVQHAALMLVLRVQGLGHTRQLSACKALKQFARSPNTRHVLHVLEIARKLVELNEKQNPLSAAPAIECIGLICDQSSENADAIVRANGLHAMLCTLEDDCPAQAQRHAIVSICKVLQRAHAQTLNPELQNGRTIALTASVLHHTAHSGVADQEQWLSWCCRVLHDAALVDPACCNKVVSVLSKKPEVLRLIDVDTQKCTREQILAALKTGQDACSNVFLAKVAKLQLLEDAVASELVRGHHPLLSKNPVGTGPAGTSSFTPHPSNQVAPHARPPQLRSSHSSGDVHTGARAGKGRGGSYLAGRPYKDTANTFDTEAAAFGSTVARTFEVSDMPGTSGGPLVESAGDRWGAGEVAVVEPARQTQHAQRHTEPSPLQNSNRNRDLVDSQAVLDSGQEVLGLSVGAAVGRDTAWEGARDGPTSDVARHRGARESSPEGLDGKIVGPHQLRHTSLHSGSRCNLKCPDSNLKKEDKVADDQPRFADSFQKPSSGSPPGTLALSALNIKHMKIS